MKKLVFFGRSHFQYNGFDSLRMILNDAIKREDFIYVEPKKTLGFMWMELFRTKRGFRKWGSLFGTPFHNLAYKNYLSKSKKININDEVYFVFVRFETWYFGEKGFLNYLRDKYPKSKTVYYILNADKYLDVKIRDFKNEFDYLITVDERDAIKEEIIYYPLPYSDSIIEKNDAIECDCYYAGRAKERYTEIQDVYRKLTDHGLKCEFYLINCPKEHQRYADEIHYCAPINYDEIIKGEKKARILFDICQEGQQAYTLRVPEAYTFGKKLLTNNVAIEEKEIYKEGFISIYQNADDIDFDFLKKENLKPINKDYFSCDKFVEYIMSL